MCTTVVGLANRSYNRRDASHGGDDQGAAKLDRVVLFQSCQVSASGIERCNVALGGNTGTSLAHEAPSMQRKHPTVTFMTQSILGDHVVRHGERKSNGDVYRLPHARRSSALILFQANTAHNEKTLLRPWNAMMSWTTPRLKVPMKRPVHDHATQGAIRKASSGERVAGDTRSTITLPCFSIELPVYDLLACNVGDSGAGFQDSHCI
ncbi:hypothetical protein C8Q78DRAFT_429174 [Trametes maxima]|nr:hypothetical protein C8Q78DRAFT_429174 [Trametes maxima]